MKFSNATITQFIEEYYPHLGIIQSIDVLASQENSETYKISTDNGKYVLHNNKKDSKKRIEKMCQVLTKISKSKKSKVVQIIETNHKAFCENNCYVSTFEVGKKFSGNKKEFLALARNLSNLHNQLENSKFEYLFRPNYKLYSLLTLDEINRLEQLVDKNQKVTKIEKILKKNLPFITEQIKTNSAHRIKEPLSKQIIHFDLHPGNVLFKNNDVKAFLDFNSIRQGVVLEDVMFAAFRFAYKMTKNPKQIHILIFQFIQEYYNKEKSFLESDLQFFLVRSILYRICFILKKFFFQHSNFWISDLENQINHLKLVKKIF